MAHSTHDCAPTLTDSQVLEFCKYGHLMLEAVVPEETNARCRRWLDEHHAGDGPAELQELLGEEWFFEGVVRNPQGAGALRSLLGADYVEPTWLTYFKGIGPAEANQWHIDGGSRFGPELDVLKWFYYPADSPVESGPTEFVPGSHHVYNQVRFMAHYGEIGGTWKAIAPAGSIYLTAYSLWHRRARATWDGVRYMVTSSAWRTSPPRRDWVQEPGFDVKAADYTSTAPRFGEQVRAAHDNARMFLWLCGRAEEFQPAAGPSWPQSTPGNRARYGAPGERPS